MKHALAALTALIGAGLVLAAGTVLVEGVDSSATLAREGATSGEVQPVVDAEGQGRPVRVRDPLLVTNKDGSVSLGAFLHNENDVDVALAGVVIWVDRHRVPVNATEMWLPVPAGDQSQVGAASDAGGFVVPGGLGRATHADVEFRFDDGTCELADVEIVARVEKLRFIYPRSGQAIGPVTTDEPPRGTSSCADEAHRRGSARDDAVKRAQDELADAVTKKADAARSAATVSD